MNEQTYHWTLASAVWQIQNGLSGGRTDSAHAWIKDKIENGSVSEVQEIAEKLFDVVGALVRKSSRCAYCGDEVKADRKGYLRATDPNDGQPLWCDPSPDKRHVLEGR